MQQRFPQFEILECLGRGGMGIVYKARQKALDRMVAIKVLAGERQGDVGFSRRFEREAKLLAQMSHANIVTVHDFGEADGLYYIVMEYVDGVNLRDLLQDGKMDPKQALAIVPPVCEALQYAHDRGVVHRDIKPENLLLDREGRVKIADFGIASLVGTDADRSGTPPYMAPEQQAAKGSVDHRADIYALGVVFYEMLTGQRPEQDPSRPSQRVEIDVRLDEIVLRALEKEPARRYQTAGEFRTVVETVAAETPTEEPPSSREVRPPAAAPVRATSFSRTAIIGAIWASLFFIAFVPMFTVYSVPAGQYDGPAWWQYLLMFTLLPLGLAAPFGTTILGSVALTQIRRSAGKLYGLGLALFDVLLFPLLALDALIGGFWLLLFRAFASSISGYLQPSPVNVFLATLVTAIIIDIMIIRWAWRAANKPVGNEVPGDATPETTAPRQRRMKFGVIIGLFIAAVSALLFWAQQPRMIDERTIAADSPDEMFSAMGQTWHSMRIMGGDRTFHRFQVQGRAGAVFESWEVPVPTEKLATSYVALSLDEVLFGKHGKIVWSDDGKRASFQVKGIEVAGFDTESGKPTGPEEDQATGERVPPRFTEWQGYTLHDLESGRKDGCLNLSRGHMDTLTEERWRTEGADALLTVEFASGKMALAVGGATEFLLVEVGRDVARDPQRVVQLLLDSAGMKPEDGHEIIEDEGGVFHILPGDGKGRTYAFAVAMPHGLPVAGLIEIGEADLAAETLGIRHRGLEIVEANLPPKSAGSVIGFASRKCSKNAGGRHSKKAVGRKTVWNTRPAHTWRRCVAAEYGKASALSARPLDRKEFDILTSMMSTIHGAAPERMTEFVELHGEGDHAVARIASPPGKLDLRPSLILKLSRENWGMFAGPFPAAAGTSSAEELERVRADFQRADNGEPDDERIEHRLREVLPTLVDETDYQEGLERQRKPPMEHAVDALVHGNKMELIACAGYPSPGSAWWAPDGTVLEEPRVDASDFDLRSVIDPSNRWLTALFRVPGGLGPLLGGDSLQRADGGAWLWSGRQFRDGQPADELAAIAVAFPAGAPRGDLTIRVARGVWRHEVTVDARALLASGKAAEGEIAWSVAERTDDRLVLQIRHPDDERQWRLALLHQVQVTLAEPVHGNAGNAKGAAAPIVAWQFSGVESHAGNRFVLQSRPYERIEFHDVALQPKTE